jgi:DNA-binding CsgD family transcriptional regulator
MYNLIIINEKIEEAERLKSKLSDRYYVKGIFPSIERFVELLPHKTNHYITIYCNGCLDNFITHINSRFIVFNDLEDDKLLFNAIQMGVTNFVHKSQKISELIDVISIVSMGGCYVSSTMIHKFFNYIQNVNKIILGKERNKYDSLSKREYMVFELLLSGISYKEISNNLNVSIDTIRKHISKIYKKLDIHSKGELYNLHYNVVLKSKKNNTLLN